MSSLSTPQLCSKARSPHNQRAGRSLPRGIAPVVPLCPLQSHHSKSAAILIRGVARGALPGPSYSATRSPGSLRDYAPPWLRGVGCWERSCKSDTLSSKRSRTARIEGNRQGLCWFGIAQALRNRAQKELYIQAIQADGSVLVTAPACATAALTAPADLCQGVIQE